jgi:hypothetical protein
MRDPLLMPLIPNETIPFIYPDRTDNEFLMNRFKHEVTEIVMIDDDELESENEYEK